MKTVLTFLLLGLVTGLTGTAFSQSLALRRPLDKPNVIIVFLDDAGYGDFAFTGNKNVKTPNLDKMSKDGMSFSNFYSGSPACSASRYALMTGKSPAKSGFKRWVLSSDDADYMKPEEQTIAELMKKAGYVTGMIGKWHLGVPNTHNGYTPDSLPIAHGFDSWTGIPYSNDMTPSVLLKQKGDSKDYPSADIVERPVKAETLMQRYFDQACSFVKENKSKPFFLYVATAMPHYPVAASKKFQGSSSTKRLYDDVIQEIDDCVGRLLKTVDSEGLAGNTLVIFTSDNGPWLIKGKGAGTALPFRDGKGSTFEGGMREPGLFRWTGVIAPNSTSDAIVSVLDILPSLAQLSGGKIETWGSLDGRSILHYLNPKAWKAVPRDDDYALIMTGKGTNAPIAVRWKNWKLHVDTFSQLWGHKLQDENNSPVVKASMSKPLLYDLSNDIAETTDVADENRKVVNEMKKRLQEFKKQVDKEKRK